MGRLLIDHRFIRHRKFNGWTPAQKWALLELMDELNELETCGQIPPLSSLPRTIKPALLRQAEDSGWLERRANGALWFHDWKVYNGETADSRVAAYLENHPEASANEIVRHVPGRRAEILAAVRDLRGGSLSGS